MILWLSFLLIFAIVSSIFIIRWLFPQVILLEEAPDLSKADPNE